MSLLLPPPEHRGATQPVQLYILIRACELLGALLFLPVLPWWQPMLWFTLVAGTGTWGFWRVRRPDFKLLPEARRRAIYRRYVWQSALAVGSAGFLLYVPGEHGLHALLGLYMTMTASLVAMWGVRDLPRTGVAVALIIGPMALRFMFDGVRGPRPMLLVLGLCGALLGVMIVYTAMVQARRMARESVLRQRAERATDAMAELSLSKSRFFAAVSHDLRQPVHAIGLYLESLTRVMAEQGDAEARRAVNGIRQSWRALDELLSQVLDLTRMDAGTLRASIGAVELAPLVRAVVMQHSAAAERAGVRVVALLGDERARHAFADELMLRRALSNLLDNAIKFSQPGQRVLVALRPGAQCWQLQVRDAGPGIAADQHDGVFQEFVQLDNQARDRQQGYGLGLAISRRFARLMLGSLTLRSAPGAGSCFTLALPRASAPCAPVLDDAAQGPSSQLPCDDIVFLPAARDILLVEDDPLVADAMCQLLGNWGQTVRHVNSVAEAWHQREFGQLAICDVRLPGGGNGLALALQLRALGKQVVLISGETDAALCTQAASAGLPLLTKPVSGAQMMVLLQDA